MTNGKVNYRDKDSYCTATPMEPHSACQFFGKCVVQGVCYYHSHGVCLSEEAKAAVKNSVIPATEPESSKTEE
jgi:hypothetical protein